MKLEFSPQIFEKFSNIKFHENPTSGSQATVPRGRTNMSLFAVLQMRLKMIKYMGVIILIVNVESEMKIMIKVTI
jgi:hypothetical protein